MRGPIGRPGCRAVSVRCAGVQRPPDFFKEVGRPILALDCSARHRRWGFRAGLSVFPPSLIEHTQVQGRAEQRPLCAHGLQPPDCPSPKTVVLLELSKASFDNLAAWLIKRLRPRFLQAGAHGLHHRGVRPDFDLTAFGIAGAECAHRTIAVVAAIAFDALARFGRVPFMIYLTALGAGHGVRGGIVRKMPAGVGVVVGGFALRRRRQQIQLIDKLPQETGRVIGGRPVFQGGREQKLLAVIRGDRLSQIGLDAQSNT